MGMSSDREEELTAAAGALLDVEELAGFGLDWPKKPPLRPENMELSAFLAIGCAVTGGATLVSPGLEPVTLDVAGTLGVDVVAALAEAELGLMRKTGAGCASGALD
jgi:hypothetical protein